MDLIGKVQFSMRGYHFVMLEPTYRVLCLHLITRMFSYLSSLVISHFIRLTLCYQCRTNAKYYMTSDHKPGAG